MSVEVPGNSACVAALQQIIFNADRSAFARMIRDRSRTTQVSLSILQWMGEDASPVGHNVIVLIARDEWNGMDSDESFAPASGFRRVSPVRGSLRTKIRAESSSNGSEVRSVPSAGVTSPQKSELRAHQMARKCGVRGSLRTKIRVESSSNGSEVRSVPSAGVTSHKNPS